MAEAQATPTGARRRPAFPFLLLGAPLVLLLLFSFGPLAVLMTGGLLSGALGCTMPMNAEPGSCPVAGVDLAPFFSFATAMGYLAFWTVPTGLPLLSVWLVAAVAVTLIWFFRRRRAP